MFPTLVALGVVVLATVRVTAQSGQPTVGRKTAAEEAAIKDPNKECEPYFHPPIVNALASFPPIWQSATILLGDTNAQAKWDSIKANVPTISPKGTLQGNFENENYGEDDPDCWWTVSKCTTPKHTGIFEDIFTLPEPRTLGYGFDDGPNCSHNAFYDYLQKQNQKATMFYIGSNVMDWPLEAERAVADGHEICIHGWSHQYMTAFQSEDAFAELYYSKFIGIMEAVKLATGVTPTCWRPPFGDVDDRIRAISQGLGLRTILWQYDSQDWQVGITAGFGPELVDKEYQTMIDDANKGMFNTTGTMILMHELNDYTMDMAIKYYPKLKESFRHIVPVAIGLNVTQPYVESDHTFPTFAQYVNTGATLVTNLTQTNSSTSTSTLPAASPTQNGRQTASASRLAWIGSSATAKVVATILLAFVCVVGFGAN